MTPRALCFIDGSNNYAAIKALNLYIDYIALRKYLKEHYNLLRIYYYTALPPFNKPSDLTRIMGFISYNGYTIISRTIKEYVQANGLVQTKGNMDVEIAVDMLTMSKYVDEIILFSGDGDFTYALKTLKYMGKQVTIFSTVCTTPPICSQELRKEADTFIDLASSLDFMSNFPPNHLGKTL